MASTMSAVSKLTAWQRASFSTASAIDDEGARGIFLHLAEHRSITEEEIIRKLGTAREARRFALGFDAHLKLLPFKVRSETNASGKRYVREEDN